MNIFEQQYLQIAILAAIVTTLLVSAVTVSFDKYFEKESRVKLFVLAASILAAVITINFDLTNWQVFLTRIIITISFAVLFYHYLGGKFIRALMLKIKKWLPAFKDDTDANK